MLRKIIAPSVRPSQIGNANIAVVTHKNSLGCDLLTRQYWKTPTILKLLFNLFPSVYFQFISHISRKWNYCLILILFILLHHIQHNLVSGSNSKGGPTQLVRGKSCHNHDIETRDRYGITRYFRRHVFLRIFCIFQKKPTGHIPSCWRLFLPCKYRQAKVWVWKVNSKYMQEIFDCIKSL